MKQYFTILLFLCFQILTAQDTRIEVEARYICGEPFEGNYIISLYNEAGELLSIVENEPADFTDLENYQKYRITIESDETYLPEFGIADILLLNQHHLQLIETDEYFRVGAKWDGQGGIPNSFDQIAYNRVLLGIDPLPITEWIFVEKNYHFDFILPRPFNEIITHNAPTHHQFVFEAVRHRSPLASITQYCEDCEIQVDSSPTAIRVKDQYLLKDVTNIIPVFINKEDNISGIVAHFNFKNAVVEEFENAFASSSRVFNSNQTVSLINTNIGVQIPGEDEVILGYFHIKPDTSDYLHTFIDLNTDNNNEGVKKTGECLSLLTNIELEFKDRIRPDCVVEWPEDITIPKCTEDFQSGYPLFDPECNSFDFFIYYYDVEVEECSHIQRTWFEYNDFNPVIDSFVQNIYIDPNVGIECIFELVVDIIEGPEEIKVTDLLVEFDSSLDYSFSNEISDTLLLIENIEPLEFIQRVNNLNDGSFCFTKIIKQPCLPVELNIKDTIQLFGSHDFHIEGKDFDNGSVLGCDTTSFQIAFATGSYSNFKNFNTFGQDTLLPLRLRYFLEGYWRNYGTVYADLRNISGDSLIFILEERYLLAGEEYDISFRSPNFEDIASIQFGIESTFGKIIDLLPNSLSGGGLGYNLVTDEFLILSFFSIESINISGNSELFSLKIKPESDGNLSDFLKLSDEYPIEVSKGDFSVIGLRLVFEFATSVQQFETLQPALKVFPNPTNGEEIYLEVSNFSPGDVSINLMDLNGKMLKHFNHQVIGKQSEIIDFPLNNSFPAGFYIINIIQEGITVTNKIIIKD